MKRTARTGRAMAHEQHQERRAVPPPPSRKRDDIPRLELEAGMAIYEGMDQPIYVVDPSSHEVLYLNATAKELWGEDSVGRECYRALRGQSAPCPDCPNEQITDGRPGDVYVWEYRNELTQRWYRCSVKRIRWPDGRMVHCQVATDITELKLDQQRVEEERSRVLAVLDGIEDVIYVADPETYELLHVNEAFKANWGGDVIGRKCFRVLQDRDCPCPFCTNDKIFGEELGSAYVWEFQNEVTKQWFRCSDKAIRWTDGRMVRFELASDITRRKRVEQERERLASELIRKNREMAQLVYVASHDLRSPLVNVQGFSRELRESIRQLRALLENTDGGTRPGEDVRGILDEDIPESIDYILTAVEQMDRLLTGLLQVSRLGRSPLTLVDLDMPRLVDDVVRGLAYQASQAGADVHVGEMPTCRGDDGHIRQVFSNLVGNAVKYLCPGRRGDIRIAGERRNGEAVYCVADNGIGIDPEHQENVFELFHRLNPRDSVGDGLGLNIVRTIVERHGGRVWVESEPGVGSSFYVSLPAGGRPHGPTGQQTTEDGSARP